MVPLFKTLNSNIGCMLTIDNHKFNQDKKGMVFIARQHPGESCSSYMIEGLIIFLLSDTQEAQELRNKYVIKIVPMINIDGVIYGNYRCSLIGRDLNRIWNMPSKLFHPEIFYTKQMIQDFSNIYQVDLFIDFHGHSKQFNAFFYACSSKKYPQLFKVFPYQVCKQNPKFRFNNCTFNMSKYMQNCARITMFKSLDLINCLTLECSFFAYRDQFQQIRYLNQNDMREIGAQVAQTQAYFVNEKIDLDQPIQQESQIYNLIEKINEIELEKNSEDSVSDLQSDSNPSADEFDELELLQVLENKSQISTFVKKKSFKKINKHKKMIKKLEKINIVTNEFYQTKVLENQLKFKKPLTKVQQKQYRDKAIQTEKEIQFKYIKLINDILENQDKILHLTKLSHNYDTSIQQKYDSEKYIESSTQTLLSFQNKFIHDDNDEKLIIPFINSQNNYDSSTIKRRPVSVSEKKLSQNKSRPASVLSDKKIPYNLIKNNNNDNQKFLNMINNIAITNKSQIYQKSNKLKDNQNNCNLQSTNNMIQRPNFNNNHIQTQSLDFQIQEKFNKIDIEIYKQIQPKIIIKIKKTSNIV